LTRRPTVPGVTDPPDEVLTDAQLVLASALVGDGVAVAHAFDSLVDRGGVGAAYEVAWCLAARMVGDGLARGPWRLDYPDIESASYDARWVARFLSAYVNGDPPMATALFDAAVADGQLSKCLMTLAGSDVATLRQHRA
jgi:hypothetical protein